MTKLPTLGDMKNLDWNLRANCLGPNCGHGAKMDLGALIARFGAEYVVRQPNSFMLRMKCTACGFVGATPTCAPVGPDYANSQPRGYIMPPR